MPIIANNMLRAIIIMMAFFCGQSLAEPPKSGKFDHMTTGYPLLGGHASASCETCHVGGLFKNTPKVCDGCHAVGKRIIATPKSNTHITTDAPCESCHFNTATWLGARYNHGNAQLGQCLTCHNGRLSQAKPSSHSSGSKSTKSCDSCHRSSAWLPASWNHVGVTPGTCLTCHNGSTAPGKTNTHTGAKGTLSCDDCHGMISWLPASFSHRNVVPGTCVDCHNGSLSTGKTNTHSGLKGSLACDSCHRTSAWLPASYNHVGAAGTCSSCHNGSLAIGKTGTHTAPKLKGTNECDECHVMSAWLPAQYKHLSAAACSSCHDGSIAVGKTAGHVATVDECNQCHIGNKAWSPALGGKPANHIPYNAGVTCSNCHTGLAKVNATTLHTYSLATYSCATCHGSNTAYPNNNQDTASWPKFHESSKNPSATDCSASGCHKPLGSKGSLYNKWD